MGWADMVQGDTAQANGLQGYMTSRRRVVISGARPDSMRPLTSGAGPPPPASRSAYASRQTRSHTLPPCHLQFAVGTNVIFGIIREGCEK